MNRTRSTKLLPGIYQRGRGKFFWVKYYRGGTPHREPVRGALLPSGVVCTGRRLDEARTLLAVRKGAVAEGKPIVAKAGRLTVDDALQAVVNDFVKNKRRSLSDVEQRIRKHLLPAFGGRQLASITAADVDEYQVQRQQAQAANGTINREVALLKRAFVLAIKHGKVFTKPMFDMLEEATPRQGFFEPEQLDAVLRHLPAPLRPLIRFCALTSWRHSEVTGLQWRQVDFDAGTVRLDPGTTKNGEGRTFPMTHELRALLVAQRETVDAIQKARGVVCPFVFCWESGQRIRSFWASWRKAVVAAGCPGRVVHDLRRTAIRGFDRAGVPRSVAMKLSGHVTESVYRRYSIAAQSDLDAAAGLLDAAAGMTGTQTAKMGTRRPLATARGTK